MVVKLDKKYKLNILVESCCTQVIFDRRKVLYVGFDKECGDDLFISF